MLPKIAEYVGDPVTGAVMLASFVIGAMTADGEIKESEYELLKPKFGKFFGDAVDFDSCVDNVTAAREGIELIVDGVNDMMDNLDDKTRDDIIYVCLMICASDGKIAEREKKWIKRLATKGDD